VNKESLRLIVIRNLKELLLDNTYVQGSLYSNPKGRAEVFFIIRFNNRDQ
jgi:hypothetical protein